MKLVTKTLMLAAFVGLLWVNTVDAAVQLNWIENDRTVIVDNTVRLSKPNKKWDTQTKHYEDSAPVKWVRHIAGANPQMFLRYRTNVQGKTAHHYATQKVKHELADRGISVDRIEKQVINNRHVAIIHGSKGNERYIVGVWRHRDLGFYLECVAESDKFSSYLAEFNQAIASVQILKESGL